MAKSTFGLAKKNIRGLTEEYLNVHDEQLTHSEATIFCRTITLD
jgi:hypothetical protein